MRERAVISAADIRWELEPLQQVTAGAPAMPCGDALAELAMSEPHLINRVTDLTTEKDAHRLLAQQSLHLLHEVVLERDLLREQRRLDLQRRGRA